jgi:ferredoxin
MPRDQDNNDQGAQKTPGVLHHLLSRRAKLISNRMPHGEFERPASAADPEQHNQPSLNDQYTDEDQPISNISPVPQPFDEYSDHKLLKPSVVNQGAHRDVLRDWFHSSSFNSCDGLDDYDHDFNAFQPLKDIITADMLYHMERHRQVRTKTNPTKFESDIQCKSSPETSDEKCFTEIPGDIKNVQNEISPLKLFSSGRVMIIGPEADVRAYGRRLGSRLNCILLVNSDENAGCQQIAVFENTTLPLIRGKIAEIKGFLGKFTVTVMINNEKHPVTSLLDLDKAGVDLILDLDSPPHIQCERPPLGYFAPGNDSEALIRMINELPDMVGEFEKPKFISEAPDLCAHHRSGFSGCSRCISICPSDAIRAKDDAVEINHYLCQGCGLCAAVCPTGALVNRHMSTGELLKKIKDELQDVQPDASFNSSLVFHEPEACSKLLMQISSELAEPVIQLSVEDIGSIGMEVWFAALAYGAGRVILVSTPQTTLSMRKAIKTRLSYTSLILQGMGYSTDRVVLVSGVSEEKDTRDGFGKLKNQPSKTASEAATFSPTQDKRKLMRFAIQHLYDQSLRTKSRVSLPPGAPFGAIRIDKDACTFCMACAQICPTSAIRSGINQPQINLIEAQCVQCGLCHQACPEEAITLYPRIVYNRNESESQKILNQEASFSCICCGKPFAAARLIERMVTRLNGHWMYRSQAELQRLKMCHNCRLQDIFDQHHSEEIR